MTSARFPSSFSIMQANEQELWRLAVSWRYRSELFSSIGFPEPRVLFSNIAEQAARKARDPTGKPLGERL
jgi:hypothetical protein